MSDGDFVELGQKNFQAPHCNASMLHAPGECYYCDHYPQRQQAYIDGGIPFTPNESNGWSGNVAVKAGEVHSHMGAIYTVGGGEWRDAYEIGWPLPLTPLPASDSLWTRIKRLFRR